MRKVASMARDTDVVRFAVMSGDGIPETAAATVPCSGPRWRPAENTMESQG